MLTLDLVMGGAPQSATEVHTAIIYITFVPRAYAAEELSEQCVNAMRTDAAGAPSDENALLDKSLQPQTKIRNALPINLNKFQD